jgi:hypothetical protein
VILSERARAGYFYVAAQNALEGGTFPNLAAVMADDLAATAPPLALAAAVSPAATSLTPVRTSPVPPSKIVELKDVSNLRTSPSLSSDIVATPTQGTKLAVIGDIATQSGSNWYPVAEPSGQQLAYVRTDRVRILRNNPEPTVLSMDFVGSSLAVLSDSSIAKLTGIFKGELGSAISKVTIQGFQPGENSNTKGSTADQILLLERQAAVVHIISQLGYDASKVIVKTHKADTASKFNSVEVVING